MQYLLPRRDFVHDLPPVEHQDVTLAPKLWFYLYEQSRAGIGGADNAVLWNKSYNVSYDLRAVLVFSVSKPLIRRFRGRTRCRNSLY